jgi:hypothetical protein
MKYPPTPLGAEALRCASDKASEGYPPMAKSAEAAVLRYMDDSGTGYAFIHRQSPCLHAEVPAFAETLCAGVSARRRGLLRRRIKHYALCALH